MDIRRFIQILHKIRNNGVYKTHVYHQNKQDIVLFDPGNHSVFMTYDFFNTPEGLRLIEINTNGGGFLVSMLLHSFCSSVDESERVTITNMIKEMFLNEHFLATGKKELKTVVIVDENPETQKLYFEFLGFQKLFHSFGWTTEICDPKDLYFETDNKRLKTKSGLNVDLVYNRHCDFLFEDDTLSHLKTAYLSGAICLTPNPHDYALLADKQRLIDLSHTDFLHSLNLSVSEVALMQKLIPQALSMDDLSLSDIHKHKGDYFFKPMHSFGSKGVYSGKKMSHKKIDEIYNEPYILQPLFSPKTIHIPGIESSFKEEIRVFSYMAEAQLFAARLYRGQAFNMKEQGGGFAAIHIEN